MAEHIHTHSVKVYADEGVEYEARTYGAQRADGTWSGWIEFHPRDGSGSVLRTGQETSQPNRAAVEYWAGGLEPICFDGALTRAHNSSDV